MTSGMQKGRLKGNTVMTAVSASVIVGTTYSTTQADTVTAAPTAVYENCPPLFMTPNELATYMDSVLCEKPQYGSSDIG